MIKKLIKYLPALILVILFASFFSPKSFASPSASVIFDTKDKVSPGKTVRVDVYISSNTDVNAAQLNILYPVSEFTFNSIDSTASKFTIKAQETQERGSIIEARGNIQPLKGKQLFITVIFTAKSGASIKDISYAKDGSLVMSLDHVNILSGSQVMTVKPITPTPTPAPAKGFTNLLFKAVGEFFHGLFGK